MKNERVTENIVRQLLKSKGYYKDKDIIVEEQRSQHPIVQKCLKNASKGGKGAGFPEFIIRSAKEKDLVIIVECKADVAQHESGTFDKFAGFAVDGALLYAS